jgi:transposase-like protein
MSRRQHANATTTPEMRAFIRESDLPVARLARLLRVSEATVRKWRRRDSVEDAPHTPKHLKTTLTPAQEYVVLELRTQLLLSLDELHAVTVEFINPHVSRAGIARCLKRHGVSRLREIDGEHVVGDADEPVRVTIEDTRTHTPITSEISPQAMAAVLARETGEVPDVVNVKAVQLPEFPGEGRRRLLIASDPRSRWVYVDMYDDNDASAANRYMKHVLHNAPFHIRRILAGNFQEFLRRFRLMAETGGDATTPASGHHEPADATETETTN